MDFSRVVLGGSSGSVEQRGLKGLIEVMSNLGNALVTELTEER